MWQHTLARSFLAQFDPGFEVYFRVDTLVKTADMPVIREVTVDGNKVVNVTPFTRTHLE